MIRIVLVILGSVVGSALTSLAAMTSCSPKENSGFHKGLWDSWRSDITIAIVLDVLAAVAFWASFTYAPEWWCVAPGVVIAFIASLVLWSPTRVAVDEYCKRIARQDARDRTTQPSSDWMKFMSGFRRLLKTTTLLRACNLVVCPVVLVILLLAWVYRSHA